MALRWFLLAGLLAACFPQANPGEFRLCEVGSTACPNGSFCSERGLCEPIPQVQRSGVTVSGQISESTVPADSSRCQVPLSPSRVRGSGPWLTTPETTPFGRCPGQLPTDCPSSGGAVEPFDRPSLGQVPLELDPLDEGRTIVRDLAVKAEAISWVGLCSETGADLIPCTVAYNSASKGCRVTRNSAIPMVVSISGLPEGSHRLHVHFDGYEPLIETIEIVGLQRQMLRPANPDPNDRDWVPGALNLQPSDQDGQWTLEGKSKRRRGKTLSVSS